MEWSLPTSILTSIVYRTLVVNCNDIFIITSRKSTERRGCLPHLGRPDTQCRGGCGKIMSVPSSVSRYYKHTTSTGSWPRLSLKRVNQVLEGWTLGLGISLSNLAYSKWLEWRWNTMGTFGASVTDLGWPCRGRSQAMGIEPGLNTGGICNASKMGDMINGASRIINKKSNYLEFLMNGPPSRIWPVD